MIAIKKTISLLLLVVLTAIAVLCSCGNESYVKSDKLSIVTTIFPYSEFVKNIVIDKAEVTQLIPPGAEIHDFEPTPKDVIKIKEADLFIYNGGESDEWVEKILESIGSDVKVLCMFDYADLLYEEDIDHKKGDEYDEHIWTSISNDIKLINAVSSQIIKLDSENKNFYESNTKAYVNKLRSLGDDFKADVRASAHKPVIIADRFPLLYLAKEFKITFESAFPGCTAETQPSIKTVTKLIDYAREHNVPIVFHIDNSSTNLAKTICEDSDAEIQTLYSLHNITAEQAADSVTLLTLIKHNFKVLKEALG